MLQATHDAPSVFFYVVALVHLFYVALFRAESMVGWAGLTSVRPVSCNAGIPTPVQLTTQECRNSGGEILSQLQEVALWPLPLTIAIHNLPIFFWAFAAPILKLSLVAFKLPHRQNTLPAVSWQKILCWPSLDAYLLYIRRRIHEQYITR